ncbi:uncharacterized protein LOC119653574 isoform X7 [Hermetia illucens]|uniref:uncharacterized protein LOC119653574 isoform X7 n=1 Tax=Hermetia illucens TaxID=343691 RepID=UPI0018CC0C67|nr:uncharacterized protein LOC119653574 isoform X7 [Hermetia illucens]
MDLADQIDDYICSFEGIGDLTMDTLAMFIFVWAVLALFLLWLCKFLYNKYVKKDQKTATDGTKTTLSSSSSTVTSGSSSLLSSGANKLDLTGDKLRRSEPRELHSSKEVKDLSSKPLGAKGGIRSSLGKSGGSGYVPPTPPIRKRLTRKSPGPELRKSRSIVPPSNVVGPETTSVTWTSQVFRWLYSDLVIINELLNVWVQTLNEYTKKCAEDQGVVVEIVRILPDSPPPTLSNIFCNSTEANPSDMVITCDCEATPILQVKAIRQKSGKVETSHYKLTVSRFRARLSITMSYITLKGEMKIEGYPDIRIAMNSVGAIKPMDQDEQQLQEVINEVITSALRNTTYPVDFSVYSTCPRAIEMEPEYPVNYPNYPMQYDSLAYNMEHLNSQNRLSGSHMTTGKRLLVKIVKGEGLINAQDPYCVVEMDEPPQKNQTGARQGMNPYWDEHFLFDLSAQSAEILFEVYDRPANANAPPKFLGLGLVGIDELSVGPASTQVLALQPRPYETENVNGAITVEFVFIEGAEVPTGRRPYKLKEALKISTPMINEHLKNGADLADAAIKAIEEGALNTSGNPSKSTLIIHSVQRSDRSKFKVGHPNAHSSPHHPQTNGHGMQPMNHNMSGLPHQHSIDSSVQDSDRGRSRKKRDFFGTLRRRLGRSKNRTKSVDRGMIPISAENPHGETRSISADRGGLTNSSSQGPRLIVPTLDQSRRSSLSESSALSGFSSASTKTYLHEASTLVLETLENGIKRHFLVPLAIAQRPRWRRKGTKLHIYNDHTFVAKHLSGGGLLCGICTKSIPRRPGKQGYECRDCHLICHKQCHVRAPQACPNPTVLSMELSKLNTAAADRSIRKL